MACCRAFGGSSITAAVGCVFKPHTQAANMCSMHIQQPQNTSTDKCLAPLPGPHSAVAYGLTWLLPLAITMLSVPAGSSSSAAAGLLDTLQLHWVPADVAQSCSLHLGRPAWRSGDGHGSLHLPGHKDS